MDLEIVGLFGSRVAKLGRFLPSPRCDSVRWFSICNRLESLARTTSGPHAGRALEMSERLLVAPGAMFPFRRALRKTYRATAGTGPTRGNTQQAESWQPARPNCSEQVLDSWPLPWSTAG